MGPGGKIPLRKGCRANDSLTVLTFGGARTPPIPPGHMRHLIRCLLLATLAGWPEPTVAQTAVRLNLAPSTRTSEPIFDRVTSIRELADGSLLVADRTTGLLQHFDWSNEPRAIGRVGDGPGEYRMVGWLFELAGDSTLFTDSYSGRWIVLQGARIVNTISESQPHPQLLRGELLGTSMAGRVLGATVPGQEGETRSPPLQTHSRSYRLIAAPDAWTRSRGFGARAPLGVSCSRREGRGPPGSSLATRWGAVRRP